MEKNYIPAQIELRQQQLWNELKLHDFLPDSTRAVYSIDTPPPTVSGSLHIGHVFSYLHTDIQARFWRMRGFNVYYPMGWDDNGLPTERLTEKEIGARGPEMPRPEFIRKCLEVARKYEKDYEALYRRLGMSVDWSLTYSTIEDRTRRISQRSFLDLLRKDRVYRRSEPVTWCPECRTAISQAEMEELTFDSKFNDLSFGIKGGGELIVSTTRPELLPGCVAVFAHPGDGRYQHLLGKTAVVPLFNLEVPILADESIFRSNRPPIPGSYRPGIGA